MQPVVSYSLLAHESLHEHVEAAKSQSNDATINQSKHIVAVVGSTIIE
jgi:hypothetical protein